MPTIKSSAELRNDYNGISKLCHKFQEPVFITKNGKGDLAVMSIEVFEQLTARYELYEMLKVGIDEAHNGNTRPVGDVLSDIRSRRK